MKTQETRSKMKPDVYSGLPALTLACTIAIGTFALPVVAFSQTTEWTTYNVSNSQLPFDRIGPLVFDAQGNLWIASGDLSPGSSAGGLAKFDGENWTVYYSSNSGLPCNNIHALAFDGQGNLWIGTGVPLTPGRGGLAKFDGENWTVYSTSNSGLSSNFVSALAFDAQGNLWIGTGGGGLATFDGQNWTVYDRGNSGLPYSIVWDLAFDALGNLWIATVEPICGSEAGGVAKFDGENWTVYNKANSGLTSNDVWDLIFDAQGNLWVGTGDDYTPQGGGLAKFDGEHWTVYHTSNSPLTWHMVTSLALDARQNLWMGMCSAHTTTGGLAMFDGENWLVFNEWNSGLPHVTATGLAFDGQGSTWIGTYGGGLAVFRPLPRVDFNGDGIVDINDLVRLIESWGQNDPSCDIGPTVFGDGAVDAADLEVLISYWGQELDDPTLVAHWKLDETQGMIAADSAGENDGTVMGTPTWQPTGGMVNGALEFNGATFVVADHVLNPSDGPFSILAWVQGGAAGQAVISQQAGANWLVLDAATGGLKTELKGVGRSDSALYTDAIISDNTWHRVSFTWDGTCRRLYVDAVLVAEDTEDNLAASSGNLLIGTGSALAPGTYWTGLIDDVRVYNRAVKP